MVDNTLFTKKKSSNLIIVQIYVDGIIFGSTCQDMFDEFSKIMNDEFEMSMVGELNFFFGLQIKQTEDGIFFNQSKYIKEMLKKFGLEDSKPMKTPMSSDTKLTKDEECELVDSPKYRGMIDFAQILRIPCEGACVFSEGWSLDELVYGVPSKGPYQTNLPSLDDTISYIRQDREGQVTRFRHQEEIDVQEYQVLTREIEPTLNPLEEIIWENIFCLGESYVLYDCVMNPLAAQLERKPIRDRGTTRGTSRASTLSPIRYVKSLTKEVLQVFQNPPNVDPHLEPFYTRQTEIINLEVQIRDEHHGGLRSIEKGF
uniref:Retrovirus-related Pol polyprotein from transposon TNT 1-94 n=1 Tax=Tanacetum cinerariifolium TaxID=118510 RepID=A0A699HHB6_TANCI|nr:retrovirus-related Pol polyprotein from transposon TNT 1-94 [Tanacetum cinerariifolium]